MWPVRVAYTLEQCWHDVPGGTAVAALRVAEAMDLHDDVRLIGVAGRHKHLPDDPWTPPIPIAHLPIGSPWLYQSWLRFGWWPILARWVGEVLVPRYELTRDDLPDCWALHPPVVAELSWRRTAYVQADLTRSSPQLGADWHTR